MIYIEVIFGAINGNALDVDSALSATSTNPVQNKVVKAALDMLQNAIDAVAGSITKDVVEVATYDDLFDIDEPRTDVIYLTTDTQKLYLYDADAEEFNEVTNEVVDNTIYVTDLDSLLDMDLDAGMYTVAYTRRSLGGSHTTMYSLSVGKTIARIRPQSISKPMTLANAEGFAVKTYNDDDELVWQWVVYSVEGHTHTTDEISGLAQAILNATTTKQEKTDNNLNTSDKTVVGAINEVHDELNSLVHAFTIDFQDTREIVQMHTFVGQKLTHIKTANVSTLRLSINGSQQTISLTNGEWTGEISVASGALLVWQIGRTSEGSIAEISVQYQYNS